MTKNSLENDYVKFISETTTTIRKLVLYPPKHPTAIYAIKNLYSILEKIFTEKKKFNISLSPNNQLMVEDHSLDIKSSRLIEDFAKHIKKLEIESLNISSELTGEELGAFIRILLLPAEEIKQIKQIDKFFVEKGITNIKIVQYSYVKVQKGKVAIEVDEKKKQLLEQLKNKVKQYSQGEIKESQDVRRLEKDIINTIVDDFKQNKKISTATRGILKKFLLKAEDKEATLIEIRDILVAAGYLPKEVDKLIDKIKKIISEKPRARIFGVIGEEAKKLKNDNVVLQERVGRLEEAVEVKTQAVEKLKKENKRNTQEKERIDNIVHHMAEGLVVVDPNGKIVMLNPVAEKLLGVGKDSIGVSLGKTIKDEHLLTKTKNAEPNADGTIEKEIEFLSQDENTKKVLRTSSAVVEDANGKTIGMVTTLSDITRQKEVESMKTTFVANVSHELRTPLATIHQNIALLLEGLPGGLNETQTKFLNIAQGNIKRLKRLIGDLLDSAAIESGKLKLKLSPEGVNKQVKKVVEFLGAWAQTKNISLMAEPLPAEETIEVDRDKVEQVLTNLLSNAVKFTPEGGKISICAKKRNPEELFPEGAIEISVKDNGPGVAPEYLDKLFQKFERAGAVNSGIGGTGLGLSICKGIVEMHGGKIWAESKLGEGSTFTFLLPCGKRAKKEQNTD